MPDDGKVALLVIDNGVCCTTAEAREMVTVRMSDDDRCTLSMTADNEGQGGRWCAPGHHLAQLVDDGH